MTQLSTTERFHRYRALDGSTVLLCRPDQANGLCRGQIVSIEGELNFMGGSVEITIDFGKPLGRIMFPASLVPLPGEETPVFTMTLPTAWLPLPRTAKRYISEVYLEIVK